MNADAQCFWTGVKLLAVFAFTGVVSLFLGGAYLGMRYERKQTECKIEPKILIDDRYAAQVVRAIRDHKRKHGNASTGIG